MKKLIIFAAVTILIFTGCNFNNPPQADDEVPGYYSKELELTMYRVIQELVNNAMKHSEATRINVQVFSETHRLSAQVSDNGKGFDSTVADKERKGKGLENIRDRIIALNGRFDIWSRPGQGTEANIEIEIQ